MRIHHGSVALVIDRLIDEVRQESLWTILFADEIVICSESSGTVELSLQRWRYVLERRGMKSSRCKTEYICVNEGERERERETDVTVTLQGVEIIKVGEFK